MADLTGKTLGKYRLVERLGRGGMAEVYKAYQPRLDRYVAIKVMHSYLADDEGFVERFQREAKAIAALHHPHIVQVHDFDMQDDVYYMVQEFIEGGTLKAYLRQANDENRQVPLEETVRILAAICDAVDYAHRQGRIHRDIKPDNIMFDANGRPVLTDFGIASIVGGTRLTATGAMVGTPAYMSPEQGKGYPGDTRSDVYSLGVVLYEMVTGQVPFDADTPFAVVLKHVNEPLPIPHVLNPDISPDVERVILKALAKEPDDRYQTAGELAQALRDILEENRMAAWLPLDEGLLQPATGVRPAATPAAETAAMPPSQTPPPPSQETVLVSPAAGKPTRKISPWIWVVAGLGGLLLLACLLVGGVLALRTVRGRARLTLTLVAATQVAGTPTAAQTTRPTVAPSADLAALIQSGNEALGSECDGNVQGALALFEQAVQQHPNRPEGYVGRACCAVCQDRWQDADADFARAIELDPRYAPAYYWRGRARVYQNRDAEALADLSRAVELDAGLIEAWFWRGRVAGWSGDDAQEFADMNQVIALNPDFALAYLRRSALYAWYKQDNDAALADLDHYIHMRPDDPEGYAERGFVLMSMSEHEQAAAQFTLALERATEDDLFPLYFHRGEAFQFAGQPDRAIQDYDRAIQILADAETLFYRGMAYYQTGGDQAALDDLARAIGLGWDDRLGGVYHAQGWVLFRQQRYAEAVEAYSMAARYSFDHYAWPFFEGTHILLDRGRAYRLNGQLEASLQDLNNLIAQMDSWAPAYLERGLTYRALGQPVKAMQDLRQALELAEPGELRQRIEQEMENLRQGQPPDDELPDCAQAEVFCVGLVTDVGKVDDRSFNQYAWQGITQAQKELGARVQYIETVNPADNAKNIAQLADAGYDVIVTVGFGLGEATMNASQQYPQIKFIGVDQDHSAARAANLVGLLFAEDQAGFLAGALAAMATESDHIGAVLGSDTIPPVWRFGEGYRAGALYIDPDIKVTLVYHNVDLSKSFTDPEWGRAAAVELIGQNVDVIFAAAGQTGNGALLACADQDVLAIGVDIDQYETLPEARPVLLSSAIKLIGPGVFDLIRLAYQGQFPAGDNYIGQVELAPFHEFEEDVPQEVRDELAEIAHMLQSGTLKTGVPSAKP